LAKNGQRHRLKKDRCLSRKGTRWGQQIGQRPKAGAAAMGVPKGMRQITKRPKADALQRLACLLSAAAFLDAALCGCFAYSANFPRCFTACPPASAFWLPLPLPLLLQPLKINITVKLMGWCDARTDTIQVLRYEGTEYATDLMWRKDRYRGSSTPGILYTIWSAN
jgi:hypothetical protein